ncbi:MAG: hypothetical protein JJU31_08480 [Wenzhouxiangella sp.]|nr:hypothetical protein [Wenzhouxiangella sp.]
MTSISLVSHSDALAATLSRSHLALAIAAALGAGSASAATLFVDDDCTLADAIRSVNAGQSIGGCPAGDGINDTIVLPAGTQLIDDWLPIINTDVVIQGQGRDQTVVDGSDSYRPFFVRSGTVVLRDMSIVNGRALGGNGRDGGGGGAGLGGALLVYGGEVGVERVSFLANSAAGGNAVGNLARAGGGGGGLSGAGGARAIGGGGGGGWRGNGGAGGSSFQPGGAGQGYGGGGGGGESAAGGVGGQGGSGGSAGNFQGGGGGSNTAGQNGGSGGGGANGGFGNGGGGAGYFGDSGGGRGGFGGGGGGAGEYAGNAGAGGFGGGGGGGWTFSGNFGSNGGAGGLGGGGGGSGAGASSGGAGGFAAGAGTGSGSAANGVGGGGAGLGGAVFVRSGQLRLNDVLFAGNSASGGESSGNRGQGLGGALFLCAAGTGPGQISHPTASQCSASLHPESSRVCFDSNQAQDGQPDVFGPWSSELQANCHELQLSKAVTGGLPATQAGDQLEYTVAVNNIGLLTVNAVSVSSFLLGTLEFCGTLVRGAACEFSGTYTLTESDIAAGKVISTASAISEQTGLVQATLVTGVGDLIFRDRLEAAAD